MKKKKNDLDYLPKLNSELMKVAKTGIVKNRTRQEIFLESQEKLTHSSIH